LLLINDILHFAAVAYFICGIIRKTRYAPLISILLALATLILSPLLWNKGDTNNLFLNALLDLAGGCPPKAYFPVLPWIFHPLLGMIYGFGVKRYTLSSRYLFITGAILCLTGLYIEHYEPPEYQLTFFRSGPGGTLLHAGTTLIFISILDIATNRIKTTTPLNFFSWCSAHITRIYLLQWIIVMWLLSITGYETLNNIQSIIMIITVNTLTMLLVNHLTRSKNKTDES
ncbi:MAG TPA: heparan-alpha-glucosaminide N-acetyltransferase domain-containing protein, partial [Niabella sp.]|nr:heparan-alpha-glucosaminide N-acetyltransferase domain-containing protein [Niabella sp.]